MITHQDLIGQSKPGTGPTAIPRRTLIGGALAALLSSPGRVMAQGKDVPSNPFVILLKGIYQPVVHAPNLGLRGVNLNDGSYSTTQIYPISGIPGNADPHKVAGDFYVQFNGNLCAYHIPGGALTMQFTGSNVTVTPDGQGGIFIEGTYDLTILEATGIYKSFEGGHNLMVDKLHGLADGRFDEYCICNISH